jgi:hypothetical protein
MQPMGLRLSDEALSAAYDLQLPDAIFNCRTSDVTLC